MAFVSTTEFLNKRYDPMGVELNGWSETVMENMNDGDYDNIFERLHDKYAGKMNTPPELELLISLAGSAAMFHMTSTMFRSVPNMKEMARNNPEMKDAMKNMAEQLMKAQASVPSMEPQEETFDTSGRREMRGPSVDLSQFGNFMPPPQMQSMKSEPKVAFQPTPSSSGVSSDSSEQSGLSVKKVSVSEGGTRRGRKPKAMSKENTIDLD